MRSPIQGRKNHLQLQKYIKRREVNMVATEFLLVLITLFGALYYWVKRTFSYWKRHNIPHNKPTPIIGNTEVFFTMKNSFGMHLAEIYADPKFSNAPVVGVYSVHQPGLIIRDLDLVKSVLIKDFTKFSNRFVSCDPHRDALAFYNLFLVKNPVWKQVRNKISPVFTSGKIKQMYPLMIEIANDFEKHLSVESKGKNVFEMEIKELFSKLNTDFVSTVGFGLQANSLTDPDAEMRAFNRKAFDFNIKRAFDFFIAFFMPKFVSLFRVKVFPPELDNYVRETITHVMADREKTGFKRNDLIDVLVAMKKEAESSDSSDELGKNMDFLIAQALIFFTAGFETSSSTTTFAMYELSRHPEVQKRLRDEIQEALIAENGQLSYEKIQNLEYLGMVLDEVLRMYPVLPFLDREYEWKKGEAPYSLKPFHDFTLPHGMPVYISVYGLQNDPKYWPNPRHFDPERFSKENKKNINDMTYMPFGTGPRNCIGMRIGLLQAKIGLVHFLKNHYIEHLEDETVKEFDPKSLLITFKDPLRLNIVRDNLYDNTTKNK